MDDLKTYSDSRGSLTLVEAGASVPFPIERVFWIYDVPQGAARGFHANKECYEYLVAVSGSVDVVLEDKDGRRQYTLCSKDKGLLVRPETWRELANFSHGAVLLVFASHGYDTSSYINSREEFFEYINRV